MTIHYAAVTHRGKVRENNEDNFRTGGTYRSDVTVHEMSQSGRASPLQFLAAVCDGMSGEAAGEVASLLAVEGLSPPCAPGLAGARWRMSVPPTPACFMLRCYSTSGTSFQKHRPGDENWLESSSRSNIRNHEAVDSTAGAWTKNRRVSLSEACRSHFAAQGLCSHPTSCLTKPWRARLHPGLRSCMEKERHRIYEKPCVQNTNPGKYF